MAEEVIKEKVTFELWEQTARCLDDLNMLEKTDKIQVKTDDQDYLNNLLLMYLEDLWNRKNS